MRRWPWGFGPRLRLSTSSGVPQVCRCAPSVGVMWCVSVALLLMCAGACLFVFPPKVRAFSRPGGCGQGSGARKCAVSESDCKTLFCFVTDILGLVCVWLPTQHACYCERPKATSSSNSGRLGSRKERSMHRLRQYATMQAPGTSIYSSQIETSQSRTAASYFSGLS